MTRVQTEWQVKRLNAHVLMKGIRKINIKLTMRFVRVKFFLRIVV